MPASGDHGMWQWSTCQNPWGPPGARMRHPFADRVGEPVRVLARGALNSVLIEFEDGTRAVCSRHAIGTAKQRPAQGRLL